MGDTVIKRSNPIEKCKNANKGHARCSGRHQSRLLLDIYIYVVKLRHVSRSGDTTDSPSTIKIMYLLSSYFILIYSPVY